MRKSIECDSAYSDEGVDGPLFPPETLRQYALLADGERGALIGPRGEIAFLCAPRWHDDAVFSGLLGGRGAYAVTPRDQHFVWGGSHERGPMVWRSRWVTTNAGIECREALALPASPDHLTLLRRLEAQRGRAAVSISLEVCAGVGRWEMDVRRVAEGVWEGRSGDLSFRWCGARRARLEDGRLVADLDVDEAGHHDLVLEIARGSLPDRPPDPDLAWRCTAEAWGDARPDLGDSVAPGESEHSWAVLHGLTSMDGGTAGPP